MYVELASGSTLVLQLSVEGTPHPSLKWFKNGFGISSGDYQFHDDALYVVQANRTHSGTYTCRLKNLVGEHLWLEATVVIKDK